MRFAASEYILTALAIGWNLSAGHLFPVEELNGEWGTVALTAPRMTAALQAHLREGGDVRPVHVALVSGGWIASQVNRGHGGGRYHEDRGLEERARSTILPLVLQLKPLRESATVATRQRFDLPLVHGLSGGKIENGTESDLTRGGSMVLRSDTQENGEGIAPPKRCFLQRTKGEKKKVAIDNTDHTTHSA